MCIPITNEGTTEAFRQFDWPAKYSFGPCTVPRALVPSRRPPPPAEADYMLGHYFKAVLCLAGISLIMLPLYHLLADRSSQPLAERSSQPPAIPEGLHDSLVLPGSDRDCNEIAYIAIPSANSGFQNSWDSDSVSRVVSTICEAAIEMQNKSGVLCCPIVVHNIGVMKDHKCVVCIYTTFDTHHITLCDHWGKFREAR